jgi:signal transduction histidine kinase
MAAADTDWMTLVHPDDREATAAALHEARQSGAASSHQYRLRRADGGYAWVLETATPRVPGRGSAGYVGSCVDVTDMRRAQQDREALLALERAAREKAERADRSKDEFIATLSHELRTPLNAILGWIQMLQQGTVPETRRVKALDAISRNASALARLIEDLLDTSRIAAGHLELVTTPLDLAAVARTAVEAILPTAAAREVEVQLTWEEVPAVIGDAQRLQQVILNLLSNAIKFSPDAGRVQVTVTPEGTGEVAVCVRDEGAGIDPSFLPHLFDRFTQADSSTARARGGLGLGLYIAQRLTILHGGTLQAQSDGVGRGASFMLRLPAVRQSPGAPPVEGRGAAV